MRINLRNTIAGNLLNPKYMMEPVHPASLGVFRILFGLIMFIGCGRLEKYIVPWLSPQKFFMPYDGFHWIQVGTEEQMGTVFLVLKIASVLIALGLFYRFACAVFFLLWTYVFLLDKGHYNNHYYLVSLFSFLMIWIDGHAWRSLDNLFLRRKKAGQMIPRWHLLIIQIQIFVVYFFGGISKLNIDWIQGYPMRIWLSQRADWPGLGWLFAMPGSALVMSWFGIIFDLGIGFVLFWKRWRPKLIVICLTMIPFHLVNHYLWQIGIFPWMMMGTVILFFRPDLIELLIQKARTLFSTTKSGKKKAKSETNTTETTAPPFVRSPKRTKYVLWAVFIYLALQFTVPLRSFLYPRPNEWHGKASMFSWRMMLVDKMARVKFKVQLDGQLLGYVELENYISYRQYLHLARNPQQVLRFAGFICNEMQENSGIPQPDVSVRYFRSINGRPYQEVVDSTLNLCNVPYTVFTIGDWMNPFENTEKKDGGFEIITQEEAENLGIWHSR